MLGARWLATLTVLLTACGARPEPARAPAQPVPASQPAAIAPAAAPSAEPARAEQLPEPQPESSEPEALELPTECAVAGAKICTPPEHFVEKLCRSKSVDFALSMFRRSTPWTRAYLRRNTEAWYTASRLTSPVQLVLDEEVIVIASRAGGSSGIQVSGGGSYDVYRWDGKCVSVMADEVSLRRPPVPESAPIAWKALSEPTREALLADRGIKFRRNLQRDRCSSDSSTPGCEEATVDLARLIADYVRRGGKLPDPRQAVH